MVEHRDAEIIEDLAKEKDQQPIPTANVSIFRTKGSHEEMQKNIDLSKSTEMGFFKEAWDRGYGETAKLQMIESNEGLNDLHEAPNDLRA